MVGMRGAVGFFITGGLGSEGQAWREVSSYGVHHFLWFCLARCNILVTADIGYTCDLSACWVLIA